MKVKYVPIVIFLGALSLLVSSYSAGYTNTTGDDRTGASGTVGCGGSGCHSTGATAGITVTVELDSAGVSVSKYRPGGSYTVKISGNNTTSGNLPEFGFGLSVVKAVTAGTASAISAGSFGTTPAGVQEVQTSNFFVTVAEHQAPIVGTGTGNKIYTQSVPWTAPVAGTGSVTIYGVINAVNGNGSEDNNDKWNNASKTITEAGSTNGINDLDGKVEGYNVYPTVMNSNVTVAFDLKETAGVTAELISMQGQVVKTFMSGESLSAGAFKNAYDVTGIASGVYFVRVQIGSSSVVSKVIKQ